jgi:predicted metal-binding membrane protein
MSFFARRWRNGISGSLTMGTYHGLYCLGCCWPYFLLMVALGWMNIAWMGLFAGIIFGEKMWSRGIWIARAAGICLLIAGIVTVFGIVDVGNIGMVSDGSIWNSSPAEGNVSMQGLVNQPSDGGTGM